MKDLLSTEHYCYKIHTLLMKSNAYLLFYRQSPYMGYPPFSQENLDPPFFDLSKIPSPYMVRWMRDIFELNKQKQTNRKQNASNREDFKQ